MQYETKHEKYSMKQNIWCLNMCATYRPVLISTICICKCMHGPMIELHCSELLAVLVMKLCLHISSGWIALYGYIVVNHFCRAISVAAVYMALISWIQSSTVNHIQCDTWLRCLRKYTALHSRRKSWDAHPMHILTWVAHVSADPWCLYEHKASIVK